MRTLVNAAQIKREGQDEERDGGVNREFAQNVARVGTKRGFGHTTAHGGAQTTVILRLLHEDNQHQKNRSDDQDERQNTEENVHEKGSMDQSEPWFVNAPHSGAGR